MSWRGPVAPWRRRGHGARGAIAVEFGLIAPVMLMLVFGIVDFGWAINRETMVNNVSRDAVRVASLGGNYDDIKGAIEGELTNYSIPLAKVSYTISCTNTSGSNCDGTKSSYDANATSGSKVKVTITYLHGLITPIGAICDLAGGCASGDIRISKVAEMVRE